MAAHLLAIRKVLSAKNSLEVNYADMLFQPRSSLPQTKP